MIELVDETAMLSIGHPMRWTLLARGLLHTDGPAPHRTHMWHHAFFSSIAPPAASKNQIHSLPLHARVSFLHFTTPQPCMPLGRHSLSPFCSLIQLQRGAAPLHLHGAQRRPRPPSSRASRSHKPMSFSTLRWPVSHPPSLHPSLSVPLSHQLGDDGGGFRQGECSTSLLAALQLRCGRW